MSPCICASTMHAGVPTVSLNSNASTPLSFFLKSGQRRRSMASDERSDEFRFVQETLL